MDYKYSKAELDALEEKMEHPETTVLCPRCGEEIVFNAVGNSCEAKCLTDGCIRETVRGL